MFETEGKKKKISKACSMFQRTNPADKTSATKTLDSQTVFGGLKLTEALSNELKMVKSKFQDMEDSLEQAY